MLNYPGIIVNKKKKKVNERLKKAAKQFQKPTNTTHAGNSIWNNKMTIGIVTTHSTVVITL